MANKWTRRGQGQRRQDGQRIWDVRLDLRTGEVTTSAGDASLATHIRYLEAHALLPEDIESWSADRLRHPVEVARITGKQADWERALMLLAHHRSELACDILHDIEPHVPEEVASYWELAFGESLGWLGYDYIPDEEGRPMAVGKRN
jgi:hypothetical protein